MALVQRAGGGANMGLLRVDHPDVLEFVEAKRGGRSFRNFNLSVAVTDRFMEALETGASYELVNPVSGRAGSRLPVREVFDRIVEAAWESGDPGLVFLDAIARANPTPEIGVIEATNPCAGPAQVAGQLVAFPRGDAGH